MILVAFKCLVPEYPPSLHTEVLQEWQGLPLLSDMLTWNFKSGPATHRAANDIGCVQAFTSLPLSFLRIVGLILYWVKSKLAATPRAKARVWSEQRYEFGQEVTHPESQSLTAEGSI
jgi:hypothetical protein